MLTALFYKTELYITKRKCYPSQKTNSLFQLIQQAISELSDEPGTITSGEQLFSMFTRYQVPTF